MEAFWLRADSDDGATNWIDNFWPNKTLGQTFQVLIVCKAYVMYLKLLVRYDTPPKTNGWSAPKNDGLSKNDDSFNFTCGHFLVSMR